MASEFGVSAAVAREYLDILEALYLGTGGLFCETAELRFLKFVPAAYRALGLLKRRSLGLLRPDESLFRNDDVHLAALERVTPTDLPRQVA